MATHVKVLGWLQIAFGIVTLLICVAMGGVAVFIGHLFQGSMVAVSASPDGMIPFAFNPFRSLGWWLMLIGLVLSVPGIVTGVGLLRLSEWGRIMGIVVSILDIVTIHPIPLALGVYGLVILFNQETAMLFQRRSSEPGAL